ncbi:MAG: hypothetical protein M1834_005986 [Cirrosporium novae-zelandiae]|nr:MAG: hypothetical protein M1834_005986 [Cirrosporium novae-zelandiae]
MEDRLRRFESGTARRQGGASTHTPESSITNRHFSNGAISAASFNDSDILDGSCELAIEEAQDEEGHVESSVDGMGVIAFADEQDSGFFGPSSNIALMGHISNAIVATRDPTFSSSEVSPEINTAIMSTSRTISASQVQGRTPRLNLYSLPAESEALDLAEQYFSNTGFLFPYIHAESFYKTYRQMKRENFKAMRMSWLALFNMIMANAMGSRVDDRLTVNERTTSSDIFYRRAAGLSKQRDMQGTSLEMVQYLLLMVQYLQGSQRSVQTYAVHGQAVKSAFQLGLQSEEVSKRFTTIEREERKRTWYACVLMDRMLYKIMWKTIDILYGQNIGCGTTEKISEMMCHIVELEQDLAEWLLALPVELKLRANTRLVGIIGDTSTSSRLRTILTLRYLNLRNLLHRPILMRLLNNCGRAEPSDSQWAFYKQMGWSSVQLSLDSAMEIITIIHDLVGYPLSSLLAMARVNVLGLYAKKNIAFNSALAIFAIWLICSEDSNIHMKQPATFDEMRKSLDMAINALQKLDVGNHMVDRCRRYLKKLLDKGLLPNQSPETNNFNNRTRGQLALNSAGSEASSHQDSQSFLSECQNWDLGEMEMGPFIMESNLDFLKDLSGIGVP